ncbi:hypothetical protein IscW_ISCW000452, partial [Ixodes scapularis]
SAKIEQLGEMLNTQRDKMGNALGQSIYVLEKDRNKPERRRKRTRKETRRNTASAPPIKSKKPGNKDAAQIFHIWTADGSTGNNKKCSNF